MGRFVFCSLLGVMLFYAILTNWLFACAIMLAYVMGKWKEMDMNEDGLTLVEQREDTARKLNREKQKLEAEVARLNRQVDHLDKVWTQEKLRLTKELIEHKNRGNYYYDEWKAECKIVEQVIGIVCQEHKEEVKKAFTKAKLAVDKEPVESKEEWFDLSKKKPNEGQKVYLKDKLTGTQDLGEFVDRSALGISFIKRNGQKHTSSLMESQWQWRPIESNQGGDWISFEDKEPEIGQEIELKSGIDNWKVLCFYAGNKSTHADGVISADFRYAKDGSVTKYYVGRKTMSWRPI